MLRLMLKRMSRLSLKRQIQPQKILRGTRGKMMFNLKPFAFKSKRLLKSLFIVMFALMMTACVHFGAQSTVEIQPPPANLRTPCPNLTEPTDGSKASMLRWSIDTVQEYKECQSKHQRLLESWPK